MDIEWVINLVSQGPKVDASYGRAVDNVVGDRAQRCGRNAAKSRKSDNFSPTFEAGKDKIPLFADGPSDNTAPLVLVVLWHGIAHKIVLEIVGIEDAVAEVLEHISVPLTRAGF